MPRRRPLILSIAVLALVAAPSVASAAVPRDGAVLSPRTGAELVEAASLVSASQPDEIQWEIRLAAKTYEVAEPVVIATTRRVALTGPTDGRATITNAGAAGPLLRLSASESSEMHLERPTERIDLVVQGTSNATFNAVEIRSGGQLFDASIQVPSTTPNVTAVRLVPSLGVNARRARATEVSIVSEASNAAAIRASPGSYVESVDAEGGNPTLDIAEDGANTGHDTVSVLTSALVGSADTESVARIASSGASIIAEIGSSLLDGAAGATTLLDVRGAKSSSGRGWHTLRNLTLVGASASTGLRVTPGAESGPLYVLTPGLLSLGSDSALACVGAARAEKALVRTFGVFREGAADAGAACTFEEQWRRTGDPKFVDRAAGDLRPTWGSSLIDGSRNTAHSPYYDGLPGISAWSVTDLAGADRERIVVPSTTYDPPVDTVDIGAYEYQRSMPRIDDADWGQIGNRGLTAFYADTYDDDPGETDALQITWTFSDGVVSHEPVFTRRFTTDGFRSVKLEVKDPSGAENFRTFDIWPWIRPNEPATDSLDYEPQPDEEEPVYGGEPEDPDFDPFDPDFDFGIELPRPPAVNTSPVTTQRPTAPRPTTPRATPKPASQQPVLTDVTLERSRISTSRKLAPGYGNARTGEASIAIAATRKAPLRLEVARLVGGKVVPVAKGVQALRAFSGSQTLRVGARVGSARLKPGLYVLTVVAKPSGAPEERRPVKVRVVAPKRG